MQQILSLSRLVFALTLFLVLPTLAAPKTEIPAVQEYQVVGSSHYSKWGISVYDATLRAPDGHFSMDKPFSLALTYKLGLNGQKIAAQARKEMTRQKISDSKLKVWEKQMAALIPNVSKGDTLTGIRTSSGSLLLLKNGGRVGELSDPELTRAFFNIWLGDATSEPSQRKLLLGMS